MNQTIALAQTTQSARQPWVSGPHTGGGILGVAGGSVARNSGGTGPNFGIVVGDVVSSVFTDIIVALSGLTPSNALTSGNIGYTTHGIGGTLSHEIGHTVSLSHINKVGSVQPTPGVSPIMGTGAIDLPNGDRITDREFSLSGVDGQNANAPREHIQQLVDAIDLHSFGPAVDTLSPPDNSSGVALTTDLVITFDEDVVIGSGDIRIKLASDDSVVQTIDVTGGAVSIVGAVATINPADLVESTDYYIELDSGVFENLGGTDFGGIADNTTWNFTTLGVPPVVSTLSPADDATNVPFNTNLVITFGEAIAKGAGDIEIKLVSDDSVVQTIDVASAAVVIAGAVATINPADLADDTAYYIQVDPGAFKDLSDNDFAGITDTTTWNFTTAPCIGPDAYGYEGCSVSYDFIDISTTGEAITDLANLDDASAELTDAMLGDFQFKFYGTTYNNLFVSTNGLLSFDSGFDSFTNTDLTTETQPIIAPFWDNLIDTGIGEVYWEIIGEGKREFLIVQWNEFDYLGSATGDVTFQVILSEWDHSIRFNYFDITDIASAGSDGASATVGIKDAGAQGGNVLLISQDSGPNAFVGTGVSVLIKDTNVATFDGTAGDDVFVFDASGVNYAVEVNGLPYILDPSVVNEIKFDGLDGNDSILVTANALADTATLEPGMLVLENSAYLLTVCTVETIRVSGNMGDDVAFLYDSAGNDSFFGRPTYSYLSGTDFYNRVEGFKEVYANATAGDLGGDGDQAFLFDSIGNDTFRGEKTTSSMTGPGYYNQADGFDKVLAFATEGNAGGAGDRAFMHDAVGSDTFIGRPTHSTLKGTDFLLKAKSFDKVFAYADSFDEIPGIVDRALLYDSAGNDKFVSHPTHSFLSGITFFNSVDGFDRVIANASGNAGGVRDQAFLYDSAGSDKFYGAPNFSYLTGIGFFNKANNFDKVFAFASVDDGGAGDRAFLHGSVGNDRFVSRPDSSYLTGIGFYNQARDFDKVYAYASGDAGGLRDRAFLYDSAGNDQFYGRKAFSYLTGAGFFNQASGFDSVFAFATAGDDGGVGDQAFFYDSKLNDTFFGRGPNAQLTGLGFLIFAKGFDSVDAYAYNGGFDTIDNRWLNYDFFQHGDWEKIL